MREPAEAGPLCFMKRSPAVILRAISQLLLLTVIFLVPLLVFPWTIDVFETNKQIALILGVALASACFVAAMLLERRSLRAPGILMATPFVLLAATAVSAGLSLAPMTSWLGQGAQEYVSVLSLTGFVALFFLTVVVARRGRNDHLILLTMFASSAVVSIAFIPVFLGLDTGAFTNLVGAPHAFSIYLLVMTTLACGYWFTGAPFPAAWMRKLFTGSAIVTFGTCLLVLLALDSPIMWILSLVSASMLFGIALLHADKFQDPLRFMPAMSVFILALIFAILPTHFPSPFLQEVAPNLETTWNVINGAWNEGSVVFGSGPGTFSLVYPKYTALGVNNSEFWELVFDRGNAYITTQLATIGVAGVLIWIFFVTIIVFLTGKKIAASEGDWKELVPLFSAWTVLVVAAFLYAQNITLVTLFWVLSALLAARLIDQPAAAETGHRARLATVLATVIVLVGSVAAIFVALPRYAAEVAFAKAVHRNGQADTAEEVDEVIRLLDKAAATNPWNDVYYRNLAAALLRRLALLTSDEAADDEYVQSLIATTIEVADKATDLSPSNVLNWDVRGMVYRELLPVVPDAAQPSIDAYERAIELAPVNPRYRVEVAKAYLVIADNQNPLLRSDDPDIVAEAEAAKEEAMAQAEEHLTTAVALKADYAPAHYYLALLREREGDLAEAVRGLEFVKAQSPEDVGVGLQLGLLYLRQGKNELAQAELQRIIGLAPAYADAHWYLSVVFEQKGDLPNAIAEVEKVLETNPDNVTVQTRLDRLKAGQTSEEIPEPISLITP